MVLRSLAGLVALSGSLFAAGPEPGSVYKEYRLAMAGNEWRVTDPDAGHKGAAKFLPNPVLHIDIDDLKGATRAEVLIDRWGGHPGTSKKRFRCNGNDWIAIPELTTTPAGHLPVCHMSQDNPIVEVPLRHLKQGDNTLEATCGDQLCYSFRWGQWGWNAVVVRIYYGSDKPHPAGRIVSPRSGETLDEDPQLEAEVAGEVDRVDFLAHYTGYDENGDGVFADWHRAYFYNRRVEATEEDPRIQGHAGSAYRAPYRTTWSTQWVPDGKVDLVARIRGSDGTWFVTDLVEGLSLQRQDSTVKLYEPHDVPERHWVRADRRSSNKVTIPKSADLKRVVAASVHLRAWNGYHEKVTVNDWSTDIGGGDHVYAYTIRSVPASVLRNGENVIGFHSTTEHHGVEILWPGAALIVRYSKDKQ